MFFDVYPKTKLSPSTVVFAFDFHDVVVHINLLLMVKLLFATKEGRNMCLTMLKPKIFWELLRNTTLFLYSHFTGMKGVVVEELFYSVAEKYPELAKFSSFFARVANSFDVDPVTQSVIENLKQKGYQVYLFSNIGSRIFEDMKTIYPWLDKLFDGHMTSAKQDGYLKKPNKHYYKLFCDRFLSDNDKFIIFIDDHLYNLKSAVDSEYGNRFHPIYFTTGQNLYLLLQKWGIL